MDCPECQPHLAAILDHFSLDFKQDVEKRMVEFFDKEEKKTNANQPLKEPTK
jgi:hypothetical protein